MNVSAERILADIDAIAGFSEAPPSVGYARPTFSEPWRHARDYVIAQARAAGCKVRIDAAGNVHARPEAVPWETRVWLSGSHLDSVPTGGKYDGVVGVACPLEVLRAAREAGRADLPLELVVFAEEEGTTFGLGMLGSHAWAGSLSAERLAAVRNRDGKNYFEAGAPFGVVPARLAADRLRRDAYHGLIEVHAEQGLSMWKADRRVAVVTAINGRRQFAGKLTGEPNHAGSTAMADRRDALAAAAECVAGVESLAKKLDERSSHTVMTFGQVWVKPNAVNVIPGEVSFTLDFRARSLDVLADGEAELRALFDGVGRRRGVGVTLARTESLPALPMARNVVSVLRVAARRAGLGELPDAASGALHDAAVLAPVLPTAMLFVASKGGISHNPAEYSRPEDIAAAARVLAAAVESEVTA
jgi:N-carbamoyl-L-amino-acid hydrolase